VITRKLESSSPAERNAIVQHVTAKMPESMAMLKLKGFICDQGGEIVESIPGLIRVRLGETVKQSGGLFGWFSGPRTRAGSFIDMELHMEKPDPGQPSEMAITLKLMSPTGAFNADSRDKCERIGRELQAYLMGR
jgi:serine/threonine-protein kinase